MTESNERESGKEIISIGSDSSDDQIEVAIRALEAVRPVEPASE